MKTTIKLVKTILFILIIFVTLTFLTMSVMSQITKRPFMVLGYSYGLVQTASMEPEIRVGDFVIMSDVPYNDLNVGDVIAFKSVAEIVVIHEIISEHNEGFITKGINNTDTDFMLEGYITESQYLAKVTWSGLSFIGIYLVDQRLLVIGIVVLLIAVIFIIQMMSIIYQILDRQHAKYEKNLSDYKKEIAAYKETLKEQRKKRKD